MLIIWQKDGDRICNNAAANYKPWQGAQLRRILSLFYLKRDSFAPVFDQRKKACGDRSGIKCKLSCVRHTKSLLDLVDMKERTEKPLHAPLLLGAKHSNVKNDP